MKNIGIVGIGYVGRAVKSVFEKKYKIFTFDLNGKCNCESLEELVFSSKTIFICVPTPMNEDGSCNITIVENIISKINNITIDKKYSNKTIVIKSTIPPGTSSYLDLLYKEVEIVFNPEFLTESNYINDFKNQNRILLSGNDNTITNIQHLYSEVLPNAKIIKVSFEEAEMVKYFTNAFLATKVSFANEMFQLCNKLDIDFNKMIDCVLYDKRIGKSHLNVPGPDGKFGFGGSCFPKDINALMFLFKSLNVDSDILKAVIESNLKIRKEFKNNNLKED